MNCIQYKDIPESEFKHMSGASIKYSASIDNAEVIVIRDNKYHHRVWDLGQEIHDNVEYKVWEDSRCAGSGIVYSKLYIFE